MPHMRKYRFWDGFETIYPPVGPEKDREKIIAENGWVANPSAKAIISTGPVSGGVFMSFDVVKNICVSQGMEIPDGATDDEVLALIEEWEARPVEEPEDSTAILAEAMARMAAAQEFQNMMAD